MPNYFEPAVLVLQNEYTFVFPGLRSSQSRETNAGCTGATTVCQRGKDSRGRLSSHSSGLGFGALTPEKKRVPLRFLARVSLLQFIGKSCKRLRLQRGLNEH
jgi:hypothetical protein